MERTPLILAVVVAAGLASACDSGTPSASPPTTSCQPPAGGRCAGPAPIASWLNGPLTLSADGRTISGRFICGGRLVTNETAVRVEVTLIAPAGGPGSMSCALVPLSVQLQAPLGGRAVVDGVTRQALNVEHA